MMISGPAPDPRLHPHTKKLTVLVTTDEHGSLHGASKVQNFIDQTKAANPEATAVVSSGDMFSGSAVSDLEGNKTALELMKSYQMVELGNWDFNKGKEFLQEWGNKSKFSILGANVKDSKTGQQLAGTKSHDFLEMAGFKIGFIGVCTQTTAESARPEKVAGIAFTDAVEAGKKAVKECQAGGADAILALTHLTPQEDERFLTGVDGILFNLGGHTHEATPQIKDALHPMAKAGAMRSHIGRLEILMDEDTRKPLQWTYDLVPVKSLPEPESGPTKTLVDGTLTRVNGALDKPIAYLDSSIPNVYDDSSPLHHFASEHILKATGADVVAFDRGQVRGQGLMLAEGQNTISARQLMDSVPWHSKLWTITVPKQRLAEIVELSKSKAENDSLRLALAGLDTSNGQVRRSDGSELPNMVKLVTTSYIAQGNSGYFKPGEVSGPSQEWATVRSFVEEGLRQQDPRSSELPSLSQALQSGGLEVPKPI